MVLPTGINKATGLVQALADLGLSLHNTVGIGDAENDQTFLGACECGVAVANALDSVKARVDLVTAGDHGAGVAELVEQLVKDDLLSVDSRLTRHQLLIGRTLAGEAVHVMPFGRCILVAGPSAAGKTTIATSFLEQLAQQRYQYCIVDPEGDYKELPDAASLGGAEVRSLVDAVMEVLTKPDQSVAVNLLNHRLTERPTFFSALLPRLQQLRTATGRPHWIIVDEAHHLLPSGWQPASETIPGELANLVLITVHPDHVAPAAIRLVDTLIVVGRDVRSTIAAFDPAHGPTSWKLPDVLDDPSPGEAWLITATSPAVRFTVTTPESDQRRHRRKYAEGELGPDKSFYFRGPDGRLNLRAQNLMLFAQLAEGVDDETWLHHLQRRDYSRWFREAIKDEGLADEVAAVEQQGDLAANESRERVLAAIHKRYTAPS